MVGYSATQSNPLGASIQGSEIAIASQAAGDIMYFDGSSWVRLAKGSGLDHLRMNLGATAPEWAAVSGNLMLVEEKIVSGAAVQTLDFAASLNGDVDKSYIIEYACLNSNAGSQNYLVRVNGASMVSTESEQVFATAASITASSGAGNWIENAAAGAWAHGRIFIPSAVTGKQRYCLGMGGSKEANPTFCFTANRMTTPNDATNITSLGIGCSGASGIGIGSMIRLWRSL